jgi:peptidoglycan/LPS O-acetylase OafA/YrhL
MRSPNRIVWLDLVRGLSSLAVCAGHLRGVMFVPFQTLGSSSLLTKAFYAATSLGHDAVMVFFVLSGFFVGGSVLQQGDDFRWSRYATARLTRLWVVVIPALLWTLTIDSLTARIAPGVLDGALSARWTLGPKPGTYSATPLTFLANVLFLQTIAAPIFGSNQPLWSLANEACYYLVFPLFALALGLRMSRSSPRDARHPRTLFVRIVSGLVAVGILSSVAASIRIGFVVWLFGVLVAFLARRRLPVHSGLLVAVACVVFAGALAYARSATLQAGLGLSGEVSVGAGFAVLALALIHTRSPRAPLGRPAVGLSEVSYSLYLFHFPLVLLIGGTVYRDGQLPPTPANLATFFAWLVALVAGAVGFWSLFERNTDALRRWLQTRAQQAADPAVHR